MAGVGQTWPNELAYIGQEVAVRPEDEQIALYLAAVGAIPGVHVQRIHVLKVRLPSGGAMLSTTPGTPDTLTIVQGRVVFGEWKTKRGRDLESQKVWHAAVRAAGGDVRRWTCWRAATLDLADLATGETRARLLAAAGG